MSIEQSYNQT